MLKEVQSTSLMIFSALFICECSVGYLGKNIVFSEKMPFKFRTPSKGKVSKFGFRKGKQESVNTGEDECLATQFSSLHVRESSKKISSAKTYIGELQRSRRYFVLSRPCFFAVADCHEDGKLNKKYCLLEKLCFTDGLEKAFLFMCSCARSTASRKRLKAMCKDLKHLSPSSLKEKKKMSAFTYRMSIGSSWKVQKIQCLKRRKMPTTTSP